MATKIAIGGPTETERIALDKRVVERLRFLNQARAHSQVPEFSVGDRVLFQPEGREPLPGVLTRYNKRTVTVITEPGPRRTVSPGALFKVGDVHVGRGEPSVVEPGKK